MYISFKYPLEHCLTRLISADKRQLSIHTINIPDKAPNMTAKRALRSGDQNSGETRVLRSGTRVKHLPSTRFKARTKKIDGRGNNGSATKQTVEEPASQFEVASTSKPDTNAHAAVLSYESVFETSKPPSCDAPKSRCSDKDVKGDRDEKPVKMEADIKGAKQQTEQTSQKFIYIVHQDDYDDQYKEERYILGAYSSAAAASAVIPRWRDQWLEMETRGQRGSAEIREEYEDQSSIRLDSAGNNFFYWENDGWNKTAYVKAYSVYEDGSQPEDIPSYSGLR